MFSENEDLFNTIIDLKIISKLKPFDKVCRRGKNIAINQKTFWTPLWRFFGSSNREESVLEIQKICQKSIELSHNEVRGSRPEGPRPSGSSSQDTETTSPTENRFPFMELTREMKNCTQGLHNLIETYKEDAYISGKIELLESLLNEQVRENEYFLLKIKE